MSYRTIFVQENIRKKNRSYINASRNKLDFILEWIYSHFIEKLVNLNTLPSFM